MAEIEPITVAVSGYFSPVHVGHLEMFRVAKRLGDILVVIVNTDQQLALKGTVPFMSELDRLEIIANLKMVDQAVLSIDDDRTVNKTLAKLRPHIFANGGDVTLENLRERAVCEELGIRTIFNVGGAKARSSSDLIKNAVTWYNAHIGQKR